MASKQAKSKKQKSREAALDRLIKEIALTRKAADDFLKTTGIAQRKAAILSAPYQAMMPNSVGTYGTYECVCKRIKMLQGLLESIDETAKHIDNGCSYLN